MKYFICALIGYILGNINTAYIISRLKGFDIRTKGSSNAGASNATVVMGWKIGIIVGLIDILKAYVSIVIVKSLFPNLQLAGIIAGTSCIIGHIFPIHMKFKGGKGLASYIGMIWAIDWKVFLAVAFIVIAVTLITDYIALATLTTITVYPIYLYYIKAGSIAITMVAIVSIIMAYKHIINVKRIISGNEVGLRKTRSKQMQ